MKITIGDTVVKDGREIGVAENRTGTLLTVRFPESGNRREQIHRNRTKPLAELIYQARLDGKRLGLRSGISLAGDSALAELVELFGYSTGQMRRESLLKVERQLWRAGLKLSAETDRWGRDDKFKIEVRPESLSEVESESNEDTDELVSQETRMTAVELPEPFWPTALGLDRGQELEFLRCLTESEPVLCLLYVPTEANVQSWIQGTWEGIIGWAFRTAQHFLRAGTSTNGDVQVRLGTSALLHTHLKPSMLDHGAPRLEASPHALNLIAIKRELELPTDFARLRAVWPGPVFEFKPHYHGEPSADIRSINECLALVAGVEPAAVSAQSPLAVLNWAAAAYARLMSSALEGWGEIVLSTKIPRFKGSNECSTTLAMKALLGSWVKRVDSTAVLNFEHSEADEGDEDEGEDCEAPDSRGRARRRIDLHVPGMGDFEVESMRGSGPMESFYHAKTLSRVRNGTPFRLIVPNTAILWAGPYLSDLAHHLTQKGGHVMVPSATNSFLEFVGKPLGTSRADPMPSELASEPGGARTHVLEVPIRLNDVAGYAEVRSQIEELIIWPERNRHILSAASRSSGVLFFGPPGCGKSRWARAIAGKLEHEVRLVAPSDLSGPYVGWGQIMIREQFDWLAESDKRMLIIDELDAVARSRHEFQMHSDEKACVNELLIQIDRVLLNNRLLVATTNFIGSMDDAVTRSGRFGRFIPVTPPDLDECVDILAFYLRRLVTPRGSGDRLRVHVPERHALRPIIEPLYSENSNSGSLFCGADLEEAVNRAYLRRAQAAVPDGGWSQDVGLVEIDLTEDDLARSLNEVPRSVSADAVAQFLDDVKRFCSRQIMESLTRRLRTAVDT